MKFTKLLHDRILSSTIFAVALALLLAPQAWADKVPIKVTGTFDNALSVSQIGQNSLDPLFGDSFTLLFYYNPNIADSNIALNVGTFVHIVPGDGLWSLNTNDVSIFENSEYRFIAFPTLFQVGTGQNPEVTGLTLPDDPLLSIGFEQSHDAALGDFLNDGEQFDTLPDEPYFLGLGAVGASIVVDLEIVGPDDEFIDRLHGTITSVELVPEPTSLALLALGGLLIMRRRSPEVDRA